MDVLKQAGGPGAMDTDDPQISPQLEQLVLFCGGNPRYLENTLSRVSLWYSNTTDINTKEIFKCDLQELRKFNTEQDVQPERMMSILDDISTIITERFCQVGDDIKFIEGIPEILYKELHQVLVSREEKTNQGVEYQTLVRVRALSESWDFLFL